MEIQISLSAFFPPSTLSNLVMSYPIQIFVIWKLSLHLPLAERTPTIYTKLSRLEFYEFNNSRPQPGIFYQMSVSSPPSNPYCYHAAFNAKGAEEEGSVHELRSCLRSYSHPDWGLFGGTFLLTKAFHMNPQILDI